MPGDWSGGDQIAPKKILQRSHCASAARTQRKVGREGAEEFLEMSWWRPPPVRF
jgi:hypothetical protein